MSNFFRMLTFGVLFIAIFNTPLHAATVRIVPDQFNLDAELIDFESGDTTAVPEIPGVTFVREGFPNEPGWFGGNVNWSGFFGVRSYSNLVSTTYTDLAVEFGAPQQAVGAWIGQVPNFKDTHPSNVTFAAYDSSRNLLAAQTLDLPVGFDTWIFAGFASDVGISRVEWLVDDQGFFGVDNITYGSAIIPLPAASGLMFLALFALSITSQWSRSRKLRN